MMIGPKGLPASVVLRLEAAVKSAVSDPEIRDKLAARGLEARFEGFGELAQIWEHDATLSKERIDGLGLAHYRQQRKQ